MHIGLSIPSRGPLASVAAIRRFALRADELGLAHLAVPDHILVPRSIDSDYPYSENGDFPGAGGGDCMEQLTLLAYLAAITTTPRLLTSVAVVPHRGAVHTAKIISTIDVLSAGRMIFGVGAGWMREEFEAVGAPDFTARGRVTDEYLEACKALWTQAVPAYQGEYVSFRDVSFLPQPVQQPHPPIWVGGESKAALLRTVRHGDVWYPIGVNPRHLLNTPSRLCAGIARLHALAEQHDRDPASIGLAYFVNGFTEDNEITADTGERQLLTGSSAQMREDIQALADMGVTDLVLNFQRDTLDASMHALDRFQDEVRSRL
jgi:probable F420-dependent oxidoreductase